MKNRNFIATVLVLVCIITGIFITYFAFEAYADNDNTAGAAISEVNIPSETITKPTVEETEVKSHNKTEIIRPVYDPVFKDTEEAEVKEIQTAIAAKTGAEEQETELEPIVEDTPIVEEVKETSKTDYSEYPTAAFVWDYLHDAGFNDYVAAGIIGNMMVECGGHTLALQGTIYDGSGGYYGLCQWSLYYTPSIGGTSIEVQMEHLLDTMPNEFKSFGHISGYSYSEFLNISNEQTAAIAFAKTYERCGSGSYSARQSCATTALNYFTK